MWTYIAEIFNRETGKLASVEKLRKLFTRLKDQKKKVDRYSQVSIFSMLAFQIHDSRRLEESRYNKECRETGGGVGRPPPDGNATSF